LTSVGANYAQLRSGDFFVAPDALEYWSSDTSYLQNNPAVARNLGGKLPGQRFQRL
jgi:hypothetical protein